MVSAVGPSVKQTQARGGAKCLSSGVDRSESRHACQLILLIMLVMSERSETLVIGCICLLGLSMKRFLLTL